MNELLLMQKQRNYIRVSTSKRVSRIINVQVDYIYIFILHAAQFLF